MISFAVEGRMARNFEALLIDCDWEKTSSTSFILICIKKFLHLMEFWHNAWTYFDFGVLPP
jgi:hypothetical protein